MPEPVAMSVDDLLAAHDEAFVRLAYVSLLGRPPDEEGFAHYLTHVRRGVPKHRLLVDMASSPEGRRQDMKVSGLRNLVARQRRPLARLLDRLLSALTFGGPSVRQEVQASLNDVQRKLLVLGVKAQEVENQLNQLQAAHRSMLGQLLLHIETQARPSQPSAQRFTVKPGGGRIVFNLSTSRHWKARAVGIVRVERELASSLMPFENVCFVYWDATSKYFVRTSRAEAREILDDRWCETQHGGSADFSTTREELALDSDDVYVSLGLDWDLTPLHEIAPTLIESGCRSVFACYDLVPIYFPEFCVDDRFDQKFKRHFIDMAHLATTVFAISDNSCKDLERFWTDAAIDIRLPAIRVIGLANLNRPKRLPRLGARDVDRLRHIRAHSPFVLYVSSIEARKNHRLLIDIWREFYEERGEECPMLVLVGMPGWGVRDLLAQIGRMPAQQAGKIVILHDDSDVMLMHLYDHCKFSVFPSYYEGWGLAATESMAFGKACLIADAGGLAQAAQHLMPVLHPRDLPGWKSNIARLLDDDVYRMQLEADILERFTHRDWAQFSEDFIGEILPKFLSPICDLRGEH